MDDFILEFCNCDKIREQRNKIKTEIDNNIENLRIKDENIYMECKSFMEYKKTLGYTGFLKKIRDAIKIKYESKYRKDELKIASLIKIFVILKI